MKPEKAMPHTTLPTPKEGILSIRAYEAGKSKAAANKRLIKLSSNETPLGASPRAQAAYDKADTSLHRYPDSGHTALREAIGDVEKINPAQIICGAGSDELLGLLTHAYAGPGDEVLYSRHGFLMYKIYTLSNGATPVEAPEKNLRTDVDAVLAAVTSRTKLVIIANPNNPTGSYISADDMARLHAGLPSNVILVIDAAYAEYVEHADYSDGKELVAAAQNVIMLRTFSKIYGLSALRLGWGYGPTHLIDILNRVRGPFNVSAPALAAGVEAIRDTAFRDKAKAFNTKWLPWLSSEFEKLGLTSYPSAANFILVGFPTGGSKTAAHANDYLMNEGIIPREVVNYGLPDCLRITVGTEDENKSLIETLAAFMAQ